MCHSFIIRQVKTNATGGFPKKSCSQKLAGIKNICEISPFNILVSPSHFLLFPYAKMSNQICKKSDKNGREIYQKSDQGTHFVSLSGGDQVQLERKCSFFVFFAKMKRKCQHLTVFDQETYFLYFAKYYCSNTPKNGLKYLLKIYEILHLFFLSETIATF